MLTILVYDLLIILAAGLVAAIACRRLHVSLLVGYLVIGALIGDGGLSWVSHDQHELEHIAEAGVFLLLFSIGLEFSLDELSRLGRNLLIGGSVQMLLVAVPVAAIFYWAMGIGPRPAALLAAAVAFSSTVLVFKALSEWGHASLPHGRRAIGILLFQDAALVPLLLFVPLLTGAGETISPTKVVSLAIVSATFVGAVILLRWLLARWAIPKLAAYRSPELVVLFMLVSLGSVTLAAHSIGLPPAMGAFAAGLIFSGNRWTNQIEALVLPFRETFAVIFFVSLGLLFEPQLLIDQPALMLASLAGLILLKGIAATAALRLTGLDWKSATGMGIGLAHVGEFAFVLLLLGWEADVIDYQDYQRIITLAIGSLILTPLLLKRGLRWTRALVPGEPAEATFRSVGLDARQALVVGAGPIGRQITSRLETTGHDVCLIDLSPINLHPFAQQGFRTVAGDATDVAILELARVEQASLAIISVPDDDVAGRVVQAIRQLNRTGFIVVRCRFQANVSRLNKAGADQIVSEEVEAGQAIANVLLELPGPGDG